MFVYNRRRSSRVWFDSGGVLYMPMPIVLYALDLLNKYQFVYADYIVPDNEIFSPKEDNAMDVSECNRPLVRYVNLRVEHAPGMQRTFSPPPRVSNPDIHHDTCVMHVPWCMPGSLTSGSLWSQWLGKRSRHSRRMRNPQFYESDKRPIAIHISRWCKLPWHQQ